MNKDNDDGYKRLMADLEKLARKDKVQKELIRDMFIFRQMAPDITDEQVQEMLLDLEVSIDVNDFIEKM